MKSALVIPNTIPNYEDVSHEEYFEALRRWSGYYSCTSEEVEKHLAINAEYYDLLKGKC
jgi:hypothetical protein